MVGAGRRAADLLVLRLQRRRVFCRPWARRQQQLRPQPVSWESHGGPGPLPLLPESTAVQLLN